MAIEITSTQPCRAYDVEVDEDGLQDHLDLLDEFLARGVESPSAGCSGPAETPGRFRLRFFLDETLCAEYERRMSSGT